MIFEHNNLGRAMEKLKAHGKDNKKELDDERVEKPNVLAVFLAALIVVLPVLILAAGLMLLVLWLFLGGFGG